MKYRVDVLVQGYPGRSLCHGGLGWSTVTLLRDGERVILVDVGAFGVRRELAAQLKARGVSAGDVTDVVLTHAHYDHSVNFTLFPNARVWIGDEELRWAAAQPPGFDPLPELYVRELARHPKLHRLADGETFLGDLRAIAAPGHTPGHLLFHLRQPGQTLLFTGDAAKNRAELLSMRAHAADDEVLGIASIRRIREIWKEVPGTLLVPGHDLAMVLDYDGSIRYVGERRAGIAAWFDESIEHATEIDLCCPAREPAFTGLLARTP